MTEEHRRRNCHLQSRYSAYSLVHGPRCRWPPQNGALFSIMACWGLLSAACTYVLPNPSVAAPFAMIVIVQPKWSRSGPAAGR